MVNVCVLAAKGARDGFHGGKPTECTIPGTEGVKVRKLGGGRVGGDERSGDFGVEKIRQIKSVGSVGLIWGRTLVWRGCGERRCWGVRSGIGRRQLRRRRRW